MSALGRQEPVINDRRLEINWVAGNPTPTIGSKRCTTEVRLRLNAVLHTSSNTGWFRRQSGITRIQTQCLRAVIGELPRFWLSKVRTVWLPPFNQVEQPTAQWARATIYGSGRQNRSQAAVEALGPPLNRSFSFAGLASLRLALDSVPCLRCWSDVAFDFVPSCKRLGLTITGRQAGASTGDCFRIRQPLHSGGSPS